VRLNKARLFIANSKSIKLERQARRCRAAAEWLQGLTTILDHNDTDFAKV